jgi:mRNA-degrading endonuclease RelE of RelBE toxin-antitoxin system
VNDYQLIVTPPARRALSKTLPEPIATAAIEFLTGSLVAAPHRVGKPPRFEMAGVWAARRGTYRVLYRINEHSHEVIILRVEHRRDAYRPL